MIAATEDIIGFEVIEDYCVTISRKVRCLRLALVSLTYAREEQVFYLTAVDMDEDRSFRMAVSGDVLSAWRCFTGMEPTPEMAGRVACLKDGWC